MASTDIPLIVVVGAGFGGLREASHLARAKLRITVVDRGTIAELARDTLHKDFRNFDTRETRVMLVEAGSTILPGFNAALSNYAARALERLGVEIRLGEAVSACSAECVELGGPTIPARTILRAAGVAASPAADWLHAPADRARHVLVGPDLSVPGHLDIFVISDSARVETPDGTLVPGVAPAAKQEGRYAAAAIRAGLRGELQKRPFRYKNDGMLATIGKPAAIIDFGGIRLKGRLAWWVWGVAHIYFLIGLRNRLAVALNWLWVYASGQRSARLILQENVPTYSKLQVAERRVMMREDSSWR